MTPRELILKRIACENSIMRDYLSIGDKHKAFMRKLNRITSGECDDELDEIMSDTARIVGDHHDILHGAGTNKPNGIIT